MGYPFHDLLGTRRLLFHPFTDICFILPPLQQMAFFPNGALSEFSYGAFRGRAVAFSVVAFGITYLLFPGGPPAITALLAGFVGSLAAAASLRGS